MRPAPPVPTAAIGVVSTSSQATRACPLSSGPHQTSCDESIREAHRSLLAESRRGRQTLPDAPKSPSATASRPRSDSLLVPQPVPTSSASSAGQDRQLRERESHAAARAHAARTPPVRACTGSRGLAARLQRDNLPLASARSGYIDVCTILGCFPTDGSTPRWRTTSGRGVEDNRVSTLRDGM